MASLVAAHKADGRGLFGLAMDALLEEGISRRAWCGKWAWHGSLWHSNVTLG